MTDQELLDRYLSGDVRAFEAFLGRHEGPLLRFVTRLCSSRRGARELAQDIVQEVFLRLLRELRRKKRTGHPSAWLYRVSRNLVIDASRKESRMERREQLAAVPEVQPAGCCEAETREVNGVVTEKLLGLPPNQRDVLILKIQEGRTYREIAEITGLSPSNVGYLIHHGLKALAGELRTAGVI